MAAVIRLKRHLDDEPLGAVILNCKKRKRSSNDSESEVSTVLKFAGTLTTQTDDISSHISKLTKEDLEKTYKKHIPNLTSKIRQQRKEAAENSRFKVVNFFRSIDNEINSLEYRPSSVEDKLALTVLDVEAEIRANGEKNATDESDYVYDLYYTNSEGIDDSEFDSEFRVCPANEIIFDTYEDGIGMASDHDSDDSNDENNWRNDYPDEDDDDEEEDENTIDEDDIRKAVDCLSLNGDNLSSDDGEEGFSYSIDSEAVGCEEDLDHNDGRRYGELYARFKAKQKKEEEKYNKDLYHDEIDDTDEDFYD